MGAQNKLASVKLEFWQLWLCIGFAAQLNLAPVQLDTRAQFLHIDILLRKYGASVVSKYNLKVQI